MRVIYVAALAVLMPAIVASETAASMHCEVNVPERYRNQQETAAPNAQTDAQRYTEAYEAFWWNCVTVRSADYDARCPFLTSGTPAASSGARDGAANADAQIDALGKKLSRPSLQNYLRAIASTPAATDKMRPYFANPMAEPK
jgi:hypothetical protein